MCSMEVEQRHSNDVPVRKKKRENGCLGKTERHGRLWLLKIRKSETSSTAVLTVPIRKQLYIVDLK